MDRPRRRRPRRPWLGAGMVVVAALLIASGAVRPAVDATLAHAGELGFVLLSAGARAGESGTPPAVDGRGEGQVPGHEPPRGPVYELPKGYAEWVFVGAAAGLAYSEGTGRAEHQGPGAFTHVYLEPGAYRHFRRHRAFPEGTTLVLEIHAAASASGGGIARDGWYEGERRAIHAAVKDAAVPGGWAYLDFGDGSASRARPRGSGCASCHAEHGAVDNVFVQFYPVLRRALAASSRAGPERP